MTRFFVLILMSFFSCKSYKEYLKKNDCSGKYVYISKERPLKLSSNNFIFTFLTGFNNSFVEIKLNKSIVFKKMISTNFSTNFADSYKLENYKEESITIIFDKDDCLYFELDKRYKYYEIHKTKDKIYINYQNSPSILE